MPDLNRPRQEKEGRLTSVLSNFDVPLYEEVLGPKEGQPIRRSMSVTLGLTGMKCGEGRDLRIPLIGCQHFRIIHQQ